MAYNPQTDKYLEEKTRKIKIAIRERDYPMFTDEEIHFYMEEEGGNIRNTIYRLLTLKAENGAIEITGINIPDPERYFMKLALDYRDNNSGIV